MARPAPRPLTGTLIMFALAFAAAGCGSSDGQDGESALAANCDDGVDNDRDGLVDCADPSCSEDNECRPVRDGGPPPCGPSNCSTCCRADGVCAASSNLPTQCGTGGGACTDCGGLECSAAGVCVAPAGCSVDLPTSGPATDTCTGAEICICPGGPDDACQGTGTCTVASGRMYLVELDYVLADTTKPDGEAWDVGGGAPDPFAELSIGGVSAGSSSVISDTFSAQWPAPVPSWSVTINAGSSVRIDAWDEDLTTHDWLGGCEIPAITASALRSREFTCEATSSTIRAYIQPL